MRRALVNAASLARFTIRPGATTSHRGPDDAASEVRAAEIRREDVVPLGDVDLEERTELRPRRVVDERVRGRRPALSDVLEQDVPRVELPDVVEEEPRVATERGRNSLTAIRVDVRESDAVAVRVEPPGDRLADASGRSGHDGRTLPGSDPWGLTPRPGSRLDVDRVAHGHVPGLDDLAPYAEGQGLPGRHVRAVLRRSGRACRGRAARSRDRASSSRSARPCRAR